MDKSKPPSSDNDPLGSISTLQPSGPNSSFCRSAALPCRELPWDCCWRYDALLHGPMWFGSWRMTWAGARWASWMQPRHSDGHGFCSWSGSPSIDLAVSSWLAANWLTSCLGNPKWNPIKLSPASRSKDSIPPSRPMVGSPRPTWIASVGRASSFARPGGWPVVGPVGETYGKLQKLAATKWDLWFVGYTGFGLTHFLNIPCSLHHVWRPLGLFVSGNPSEIGGGLEKGTIFHGAHMEQSATRMKRLGLFCTWQVLSKKGLSGAKHQSASDRSLSVCSLAMRSLWQRTRNDVVSLQVLALCHFFSGRSNMIYLLATEDVPGTSIESVFHGRNHLWTKIFSIASWSEDLESALGLCWLHGLCPQSHCLLHRKTQRQARVCLSVHPHMIFQPSWFQPMAGRNHPNYQWRIHRKPPYIPIWMMGKIHSFRWTKSHHPIQIFVNPCLKFPSNIRFNPSTIWFSELFGSYQILGFAEKAQVSGSGPRRPSAETRRGQPDTGAGAVSRGSKTGGSMDSMDPHTWYYYFFCTKISFKISHIKMGDTFFLSFEPDPRPRIHEWWGKVEKIWIRFPDGAAQSAFQSSWMTRFSTETHGDLRIHH